MNVPSLLIRRGGALPLPPVLRILSGGAEPRPYERLSTAHITQKKRTALAVLFFAVKFYAQDFFLPTQAMPVTLRIALTA